MSVPKPVDGELLPDEAGTLRLPKPPPDFVPEGWQATWQQLAPSTGDKEHAGARNKPVRVSVWDDARTTWGQARSFRVGPTLILGLSVQDVNEVAEMSKRVLRVVYEPLDAPEDARAGAEGHAGIEGLERGNAEPKNAWRAAITVLAKRAKLLDGPG